MLKGLFFLSLLLFCSTTSFSQNIQIKEDPLVTQMLDRFTSINKSKMSVEGWRIQVLATTDRQRMESARQVFQYKYPNIPVNWEHSNPYFKLRAGAFATKLEALRLQYLLKRDYPSTLLVKDNTVKPSELVGYY